MNSHATLSFDEELLTSHSSSVKKLVDELAAEFQKLDLSVNESRILSLLITGGPQTATEVAANAHIQRTEGYRYLSRLLQLGVVFSSISKPQKYYSLPFEEAFEYLLESKRRILEEVSRNKIKYRARVKNVRSGEKITAGDRESYQVIERASVIHAISRLISNARDEAVAVLSEDALRKFHANGILEALAESSKRIQVRIITASKNFQHTFPQPNSIMVYRQAAAADLPSFLLIDGNSLTIIPDSLPNRPDAKIFAFSTNSRSLIASFEFITERIVETGLEKSW